jgi:hypothetical protein
MLNLIPADILFLIGGGMERIGEDLAAKGDDKLVVGGLARYDGGQEGEEEILWFEKLARALNKAGSFGICGK